MTDEVKTSEDAAKLLTERSVGELAEKLGIKILELSAERSVATMPVEGNTQPFGVLHGGAHVVLAETLGSMSANVWAYPDRLAVGIEAGNREVRREVSKGTFQLEDVSSVVRLIQQHDIGVAANYIFGFPDDTIDTMNQTLDLAIEMNTEMCNMRTVCIDRSLGR